MNLKPALDKSLDDHLSKLFETLIQSLANPLFTQDKSTPIDRFERGFKLALDAYEQATAVINKAQPK
jgi:hypothetical protein